MVFYGTIPVLGHRRCEKMGTLKIVLTVVFVLICIILTVIVMAQEGKSAGLTGSISGAAESFWEKNKGRTLEGKIEKSTKYVAIAFFVVALLLNMI